MTITYYKTRNDMYTVEYRGYLLHSKYDPQRESEMFVKKNVDPYKLNIIFGYGLGYVAKATEKLNINVENILFIEPISNLENILPSIYEVLQTTDGKIIKHAIESRLRFFDIKINIICLPNYNHLFLQEYNNILKTIKEIQRINKIYENTVYKSGELWQKNNIFNTLYAVNEFSLEKLNKAYDVPIVVASGGPSLSKQLDSLKKVRSHIILIASGSTVNSLVAENIEPDYIVTIDGNMDNYERHFKDLRVQNTELIFAPNSYYKIQEKFPNNQFILMHQGERKLQRYLKSKFDMSVPIFIGGGSVANFALEVAMYITTGPVGLIGQDLAYTDNMSHAANNKNAEKVDINSRNDLIKVKGYYEDEVYTDYALLAMKRQFETIIQNYPQEDTRIFNCTEGGVTIENLNQCAFSTFIERFVDTEIVIGKIKLPIKKSRNEEFVDQMQKDLMIYKEIKKEYIEALRLLKLNTSNTVFSQNILIKLDLIDQKVTELKKEVLLERIDEPISLFVMNKFKPSSEEVAEETYQRVFQQNMTLYKLLLEALEKTIIYTKEVIQAAKEK